MTTSTVKTHHIELGSSLHSLIQSVESFAKAMSAKISVWVSRSHDRKQLSQMNVRMLNDIGLTQGDVIREANKFFWQK